MSREATLHEYLRVLRRRRWLVLLSILLVPLGTVLVTLNSQETYRASSDVLLRTEHFGEELSGIDRTQPEPERLLETRRELARIPAVIRATLRAAGVPARPIPEFLENSAVRPREGTDILELTVTDPDPGLAVRLANAYAAQFKRYLQARDTAALREAGKEVAAQLDDLAKAGNSSSALYANLLQRRTQLRELEILQTSNAEIIRWAASAEEVKPRPVLNGMLGLALGLVVAVALTALAEALDTRVRSDNEVKEQLGLPLLARVPDPPWRLRGRNKLIMLGAPDRPEAEAVRLLRTNLEFINLELKARSIMVTSALSGEGKSKTVANLAIAFARSGSGVTLVNLDLRRPVLERFFNLQGSPGITDVALDDVDLEEAVVTVPIAGAMSGKAEDVSRGALYPARLRVLPLGSVPASPGEFVGSGAVGQIIDRLADVDDIVLIDAPPMLEVGDAMALSANVDAILLVTRLQLLRRPALRELHRLLDGTPAYKLGFVVTGANTPGAYGYEEHYAYRPSERERPGARAH